MLSARVAAGLALALLSPVRAQANPAHHPPAPAAGATAPMSAASPGVKPGMGGMSEMMDKMMGPSAAGAESGTPIYPSLMTLPSLTPEKRREIDALANQQISEGMSRLTKGAESLSLATQAGDSALMQQSVGMMREALGEIEAGVAAQRVIMEGKAPRNLALDWFKREMSLASPMQDDSPHSRGITGFHFFTMAMLIAFAISTVGIYFFKMRRAAALFGRLEGGAGAPAPGSAPPLAGKAPTQTPESSAAPAKASASPRVPPAKTSQPARASAASTPNAPPPREAPR